MVRHLHLARCHWIVCASARSPAAGQPRHAEALANVIADAPRWRTLARSASGAKRRGVYRGLVRLAGSVSWPPGRGLDRGGRSASHLALHLDPSSERFDSIPQPGQSRPPPRIGSADAVIANRKQKHIVLDTEADPHARGVRVL